MSWNGTVRCSHCYDTGHNKRSCPALKKYVEENPDSWRATYYNRAKKSGAKRRCTYCNLRGHNRRTCGNLKIAKAHWIEETKKFRKAWADWMAEEGLTPGAIVECSPSYRGREVVMLRGYILKNINIELQRSYYAENAFWGSYLTDYANNMPIKLPGHPVLVPQVSKDDRYCVKVLAPVKSTGKKIWKDTPDWFRAGYANSLCDGKLDDVFDKGRRSEDFDENGEKD